MAGAASASIARLGGDLRSERACRASDEACHVSDDKLMIRVQSQDRDAFALLVDRHLKTIHAFNTRFLRNPEDAADMAQEAFLRVWDRAGTYRPGRAKFTTWLHRIARNLCIDAHRRSNSAEQLDDGPADEHSLQPEQAPAQQRLAAALAQQLAALPERQRTALMLCHRQGMSNRDAAVVLGVRVDALESLLARGRRTLRAALRDYR